VLERPQTRYAKTEDGTNIAYAVVGDAPVDLVVVPGFVSHVDLTFSLDELAAFSGRLASFSRLIVFDKRGTGMSDRVDAAVPIEVRMDDIRAVMDAAGSRRAAFLGISEGGPLAITFAATYPERTHALVVYGSTARRIADPPEYPWGVTPEAHEQFVAMTEATWGTPSLAYILAPSITGDSELMDISASFLRHAASPGAASALVRWWGEIDVRPVLPTVAVPTLVLHRRGDRLIELGAGRYLADHIPGASFVELEGDDHLVWIGDSDTLLGEIEEFLTGARSEPIPERALATVLFTDIVGSTERASKEGDASWRIILDRHDRLTADTVQEHRGRVVKSTGDGIVATFDGPARGVRCALDLVERMAGIGLDLRAGLHTGEVELRGSDVGGVAVHIGARVSALAGPGEVVVSRTVKDLMLGSDLGFEDRGVHTLKGISDPWQIYAVPR